MPITGDLRTMSLYDLLDWASRTQKTGVLELERNKRCRRIEFRKGMIGACSSDDPPQRLGQFLLSKGRITREQLRTALARQREEDKNLGRILAEMGAITHAELSRQIAAKAEETIHGLFDWSDAIFRFHAGATLDPDHIAVNLPVRNILFRGIQRADELRRIREVFPSSGIVLRRTERPAPDALKDRPMSRRIFGLIDGTKTLAEVLLHAHALEFPVLRFLKKLHELKLVEIADRRRTTGTFVSLLDVDDDPPVGSIVTEEHSTEPVAEADADGGVDEERTETLESAGRVEREIEVIAELIARGDHEAALDLANAAYRQHPNDLHLRKLLTQTEAAFVTAARRELLQLERVPVLTDTASTLPAELAAPDQAFLLSQIDGRSDIQSLLWIAPMREVDLLKALWEMYASGLIDLRDASEVGGTTRYEPV